MGATVEELQRQLDTLRAENERLKHESGELRRRLQTSTSTALPPRIDTALHGDGQLPKDDIERYSRHMLLPEIGSQGVRKLRDAKVVVIGAGGIGSTACLYLAAAGVGMLRIVDDDRVELSNLHRQVIHTTARCGLLKAYSAQMSVEALNPALCVEAVVARITVETVDSMVEDMDVIVDGTDNVPSRYIIGDAAAIHRKPLIWGAALRWEAQVSVFRSPDGPCMRCIYPFLPPPNFNGTCSDAGVCGMIPGIVGCTQALEALKVIVGCGEPLIERMLVFDGRRGVWTNIRLRGRNTQCRACTGEHASVLEAARTGRYDDVVAFPLCPPAPVASEWDVEPSVLLSETAPHIVIDVRPAVHFGIFSLPSSYSLPLATLQRHEEDSVNRLVAHIHERDPRPQVAFALCRRGVASVKALPILRQALTINVYNVRRGLEGLRGIRSDVPVY